MNRLRFVLLFAGVVLSSAPAVLAGQAETEARPGVIRQRISATSYSVELPVVARIQGTAFFRTLVSFNNNTNKSGVTATYQFSYTCFSSSCSPANGFYRTNVQTITLPALGSFSQDDFVDYLNTQSLLQPGANQGTFGTLLVTFNNLPSSVGWEANVVGRTYNRLVESDATQGTVGFAYNASLFFDSAHVTLVGFARDTKSSPTLAGKLRTNVGIRNTDVCFTQLSMTVDVTFYDTVTGQRVGNVVTLTLRPGELQQIPDVWTFAAIPSTVNSVIVFADARNGSLTTPTMEGFVNIVEGFATQDAAFFTMLCGDATTCSACPP